MSQFLFELGCEEIPARFMPKLLAECKDITASWCESNRISLRN